MNRDLNTFQENIKEWVKLDTAIREINNKGKNPYEDWYIHPDLVDIELVNSVIKKK